ncbi:hypothetical protein [Pontibacillus marinus]|uniref:Sporulation protein n=1 Tax=Pontibacillus marinus BH030004 = DSM 16465 TaxID=1385511 RepID=A0A0A5G2Y2_9BACI|nr:hypothetical protein [Pontibacillus marinus]KGX86404.1 hypothetical protein N783_12200 [Pontibacillus marinus BH030004 = DSM 16465]
MRFMMVSITIMMALILGACATNPQGTQEVRDVQSLNQKNTDTFRDHNPTKNGYNLQNESPMQMNQVGETWGLKQDKQKIFEAVEEVPNVEVRRVNFNGSTAHVRVKATDISGSDERIALTNKLRRNIEGALPRYKIRVYVSQ